MIYPKTDDAMREYWEGARRSELLVQHCVDCDALWHPALPVCPRCHGNRIEWRPVSGQGVVYSFTDVHHPVHPVVESWVPYRVYLIDLDEGPRMISHCRNVDRSGGLSIGTRVRVVFEDIGTVSPQLRIVASGLRFPEGPVALPDGRILVVEVERKTLSAIAPDGTVSVVADLGGGPNGVAIGPDGRAYVCNNGGLEFREYDGALWAGLATDTYAGGWIDAGDLVNGTVERLFTAHERFTLRAPNDIVFDVEGGFWFTDFGKTFKGAAQRDRGAVYYATIDGRRLSRCAFPLEGPNGIGLSPDGRILYVAESTAARLWAFDVVGPGQIRKSPGAWHHGRMLWAPPYFAAFDSLAVDAEGNICVAEAPTGCIVQISPKGEVIAKYAMPDPLTTNVCFGGAELRSAFVTLPSTGRVVEFGWPLPGLPLPWLNAQPGGDRSSDEVHGRA